RALVQPGTHYVVAVSAADQTRTGRQPGTRRSRNRRMIPLMQAIRVSAETMPCSGWIEVASEPVEECPQGIRENAPGPHGLRRGSAPLLFAAQAAGRDSVARACQVLAED